MSSPQERRNQQNRQEGITSISLRADEPERNVLFLNLLLSGLWCVCGGGDEGMSK